MKPFDKLTSRLQSVRAARALPGERRAWSCCPAHDDQHPSLDVRELADGRILIVCHAGCGAADVVGAVGLSLSDLFPHNLKIAPAGRKGRGTGQAATMPQLVSPQEIASAAWHILACAVTMRDGHTLCDEAMLDLALIAGRMEKAEVTL